MKRRVFSFLILAFFGSEARSWAATLQTSTSVQGEQFANEQKPGSRIDLNLSVISASDSGKSPERLPDNELHFFSFYETGPGGDHSLDLDRTVQRFSIQDQAHLWIGRTHPLTEATQGESPSYVDAIGANWAQNQSDALNPRVAGWIGAGGHLEDNNRAFSVTTAFSPIFLPSFGPRLQLSENDAATGSRFSRLPPQFVEQGDAVLPLRYHLDTGDIKRIVLQPQAFISAGYANSDMRVDLMEWTAPDPSPDVDTDFALVTHTSGAKSDDFEDVMVDAHPKFRRQHFTGLRYEGSKLPGRPIASGTYEWFRQEFTASLQSTPIEYLSLGVLNRWVPNAQSPASSATVSPSYADGLVWAELSARFYHERILPSLRIENHVASDNRGRMIRPKVVYLASSNLNLFAVAQIMRGQDRTYFGEWRSLGSASMGVNWQW